MKLKTRMALEPKLVASVMRRHEGLSLESVSPGIDPNSPQTNVIGASLIQ